MIIVCFGMLVKIPTRLLLSAFNFWQTVAPSVLSVFVFPVIFLKKRFPINSHKMFPRSDCTVDSLRRRFLVEATPSNDDMVCAQMADAITPALYGQHMITHACFYHPESNKCVYLYTEFDTKVVASSVVALMMGIGDLFAEVRIYGATTATIARMLTTPGTRHTQPFVDGTPTGGGLSTAAVMHLNIGRAYMSHMCGICNHAHLSDCYSCSIDDRRTCRDVKADEMTLHVLAESMVSQLLHAGAAGVPQLWFQRYRADVARFYTARGVGGHLTNLATIPVTQLADLVGVTVSIPHNAASGNMSPLTMAEAKQERDTAAHDAIVAAEIASGKICIGCGEFVCVLCALNDSHVCRAPPPGAAFMKCHQMYRVPRAIVDIPLTLKSLIRIATGLAFTGKIKRVASSKPVYDSEAAAKIDAGRLLMHVGEYMAVSFHTTGNDTVAEIRTEPSASGGTAVCVESAAGINLATTAGGLSDRAPAGLLSSVNRVQVKLFQVPAMFAELDTSTIVDLVSLAAPTLNDALVETGVLQLTATGAYNLIMMMSPLCTWDLARTIEIELATAVSGSPSMCSSTAINSLVLLEYSAPSVVADVARGHLHLDTDPTTIQCAVVTCGIARIIVNTPDMNNLERHHTVVRDDIEAMYVKIALNPATLREDVALLQSAKSDW